MRDETAGDWRELITQSPQICHGTPCFSGTRIPVGVVLDSLAEGMPEVKIQRSYPTLPQGAVRAALAYASALSRGRVVT